MKQGRRQPPQYFNFISTLSSTDISLKYKGKETKGEQSSCAGGRKTGGNKEEETSEENHRRRDGEKTEVKIGREAIAGETEGK